MIAYEAFHRYKSQDVTGIIIVALVYYAISVLVNSIMPPHFSYPFSLLLLATCMGFIVHLVRKAGAATVFLLLAALLTQNIDDIGPTGFEKLLVLFAAGILFEIVFLVLKIKVHHLQVDIILGTAISAASIPFTTALLISYAVSSVNISTITNLMLLSFFVGLAGSIIAFLIWWKLRARQWTERFLAYA